MKQISDKEKIEIMQHYLNGGEIECKLHDEDNEDYWTIIDPSWNWADYLYRKRIYNYPLYFEFTNVHDTESEKFIVEFTGLTEGTVIQKTYSEWEIGHFDNVWFSHTDKDFWKEVENPIEEEFQEKLKYLKEIQQTFETGEYICIYYTMDKKWMVVNKPLFGTPGQYKLIHKKHEDILNAYLEDNNIKIERRTVLESPKWIKVNFIETYDSTDDYRIKEPESQIVYEVYRTNKKTGASKLLGELLTDSMIKTLENDARTQNTYHKTGRQFEIKLEKEGN